MKKEVFRAYDIRGIYPTEIDDEFAYNLGRAFGTILVNQNKKTTVIGYDNRSSSLPIFKHLTKGINDCGIDVYNIGFCTTPMLYFSYKNLNVESGIMITASHNPKEYNGFKISTNGIYNTCGDEILEIGKVMEIGDFATGVGKVIEKNIKNDYIKELTRDIEINKNIKVVVDVGNGSTSMIIKDILDELEINYIPLFFESDPSFPNHHPDPSVEKNMKQLEQAVLDNKANLGVAFDGDGDRFGMVDENGDFITSDKTMIMIARSIIHNLDDKRFLYDVKCSKALSDEIIKLGGIPIEYRTGNSYVRSKIYNDNIPFGGEFSGHIFFNDRFSGFDDAIYVALRIIEILSKSNKSCSQLLDNINKYYTSEEIKIEVSDNFKFELVDRIISMAEDNNEKVIKIDGCKIVYENGFCLIRASNTGPNVMLRVESTSEDKMIKLRDYWLNEIKKMII